MPQSKPVRKRSSWSPKIEREQRQSRLDKKMKSFVRKVRDPAKSVRSGDVGDFWDGT